MQQLPYWRLSGFYFFYFALLGIWMTYWPLYLEHLNFNYREIGIILGIMMATKIIAPGIWSWLAATTQQRPLVIRLGAIAATVAFALILPLQSYVSIALVIALFGFFWNAILAQYEVVTLSHLAGGLEYRYSQLRLWGSIGFIILVAGAGLLFDYLPISWVPCVILILLVAIAVSSCLVGEKKSGHKKTSRPKLMAVIRQRAVLAFFLVCFLLQVSHGSYYTFYSVLLEGKGYSRTVIGLLWSLGVVAEVLLFMMVNRLLHRFSLRSILMVTLVLTVLRWYLIGAFNEFIVMLLFSQCLHAASFGSFHAVAIEVIRHHFHGGNEGHGMAIYSGVTFGAGGAVGAILSGYLWSAYAAHSFYASAAIAVMALLASLSVHVNHQIPAEEAVQVVVDYE